MDQKTQEIIQRIAEEQAISANHKKFGYLKKEDLVNEVWIICLEKLPEFNKELGELEHWLRVVVSNRIVNKFKQINKFVRLPCIRCEYYAKKEDPDCVMFGHEKMNCSKWANYQSSRESRNNLLNATEEKNDRYKNDSTLDSMMGHELVEMVKDRIPQKYQRDFNNFINHEKINKQKLKTLQKIIIRIVNDIEINKFNEQNRLMELTVKGQVIGG